MNSLTETVNEQGGQIMEMKEQITHIKTIMEKQNEDITDLEHEKDVLHDTIKSQRVEMDSMGKDMMTIIEAIHTEEDGNLTKHPKGGKGNANGCTIKKSSTIANNMFVTGITRHSKNNSNAAANETDDRVLANDKGIHNMPNHNHVVLYKIGQQHTALRPGLHRIQNHAATHVAFSSYLTQYLKNLSIGHVIKFDQILLNDGNGYNKYTGVFTVPTSGVYLLTYSTENNSKNHLE